MNSEQMMYKAVFIDIDDTLLDYIPCCREAFDAAIQTITYNQSPITNEDELFQLFFDISGRLFSEAKRGKYSIAQVMDLYPREFVERVNELTNEGLNEVQIAQRTDRFTQAFRAAWGETHTLVPGAKEALEALHKKEYRLFAASNSFGHLQRKRLEHAGILMYFEDTYISMDLGYDKPDIRFYQQALRCCGLQPHEVIMVGDSMTTDIIGAQQAGLDAVYFNRRNEPLPAHRSPLPVIYSLAELESCIAAEESRVLSASLG